ncbi:MAG: serine hydrolase domain-containing protein, partial [Thermoanaerobaculia bacterium]
MKRLLCSALALAAAFAANLHAAEPSSVARDPRVVSALSLARGWLEAQRAYARIPGISAAIVSKDETLWSGGFGLADAASGRPADAQTLYSICSISKLFTSIAILQLRDEDKLRLDDPVAQRLPWFRMKTTQGEGDVTIEGLLTHSSGLPQEPVIAYWSAPDFAMPTREEIIAASGTIEALYAPEKHHQYSNLGFELLGEVVASASGEPYADYVRKNILGPLSLSSTTPFIPEAERGKRFATGYSSLDRDGKRSAIPFFTMKGVDAAAGFASDANDLARFASWQLRLLARGGKDVLKATTLAEMQRIHWVEPDFNTLWGLGFRIWKNDDVLLPGHGGSCPGFRSAVLVGPKDGVATVFLANAQSVDSPDWAMRLYDIVAPAVVAAGKEPGKAKAPDPALSRYAGTYDAQPWAGEVLILPWEDGLAMLELPTMSPMKDLEKLKKTGEHRFRRIRKDKELG